MQHLGWASDSDAIGQQLTVGNFQGSIIGIVEKYGKEHSLSDAKTYRLYLQPLTDIHLYSNLSGEAEPNSDIVYIYFLAVVAAFILLIACINFINLTTAHHTCKRGWCTKGLRYLPASIDHSVSGRIFCNSIAVNGHSWWGDLFFLASI